MLLPGHHVYHTPDSDAVQKPQVASGLRFRREDAWKLHGVFVDENGERFEGTRKPSFYSMPGLPLDRLNAQVAASL